MLSELLIAVLYFRWVARLRRRSNPAIRRQIFALKGSDGKTYKLSDFKGKKVVVLEWFNKDCPYVRKHYDSKNMQNLQNGPKTKDGVAWLTIASSAPGKEGHYRSHCQSGAQRKRHGQHGPAPGLNSGGEEVFR